MQFTCNHVQTFLHHATFESNFFQLTCPWTSEKSDVKVFKVQKTPFNSEKVAAIIKVEREGNHLLIIDHIKVSVINKGGGGTLSHYYVKILSCLSEILTYNFATKIADDELLSY